MKARSITYWASTVLVAFIFISGGLVYLMRAPTAVEGVMRLGFPLYFIVFLGFWKFLGGVAILIPRYPRLKEWAYAGIFLDLAFAAVACAATGGAWWHVVAPVAVAGVMFVSWSLRPPSRLLSGNSDKAV
jgi:uncharacterized membrane protein YphA (DoxX/SURF4 family)